MWVMKIIERIFSLLYFCVTGFFVVAGSIIAVLFGLVVGMSIYKFTVFLAPAVVENIWWVLGGVVVFSTVGYFADKLELEKNDDYGYDSQ
jgi:hypothetical protein